MQIRVIKNDTDYKEALDAIRDLMLKDPDPNTEDGEKLNLLTALVEDYESVKFPESLPDPIDAIMYRMEQENLRPKDLVPFIGARSKVSEILARKRPLTLAMIRSLEAGLGIPAKILLKEVDITREGNGVDWDKFPLKEMNRRGYFGPKLLKGSDIKKVLADFFRPLGSPLDCLGLLRKSSYKSPRPMNQYALAAWAGRVANVASEATGINAFKKIKIDIGFIRDVARFSENHTPPDVINFLKDYGIIVVIEPHFKGTYLDGALIIHDGTPTIGLTLRHDRLDNFWFTLLHELAHIAVHYDKNVSFFDYEIETSGRTQGIESDANEMAREAILPESKWESSAAKLVPSQMAAHSLAKEIGVHIAVIAGQIRFRGGKYIYLNQIVHNEKVRKYFTQHKWE